MRSKRIQNRIGESRLLLPTVVLVAGALWWLPRRPFSYWDLGGLALCYLCTYLLMEMNNVNALIRTYSRSVSSVFLLLTAVMGMLHGWLPQLVAAPALTAAMFMMTRVDEVGNRVAHTFHIFVALGIAVLAEPPLVALALVFFWNQAVFLRSLSFRAFWAGLIGLATPIWVAACVVLLTGRWALAVDWLATFCDYRLPSLQAYAGVATETRSAWVLLALMLVLGLAYYLRNASADKVRTRMLMYAFISQSVVVAVMGAAQPHRASQLLTAMNISIAPLAAHYFTLQRTWWGSVMMWLWLISLVSLAITSCKPLELLQYI